MHYRNHCQGFAKRWLGRLALSLGLVASAGAYAADVFAPGVLKVEFFKALDGVDINTLLSADKYINNQPDEVQYVTSFTSPNGYGDNYGSRVSGFLTPSESGSYDFFIRADDQAQLYISTDDKPANATLVAQEISGCCQAFQEPGVDETSQSPIALVANKRYYVYALLKEGGGGDWMEVAWRKVGDTTAAGNLKPIAGSVLGTFAPAGTVSITQEPAAVTAIEGVKASFSVKVTYQSAASPAYQWRKNGADIAGATSDSYTTPVLGLSDNGAKYSVKVSVPGAEQVSSEVVLTVNKDTFPPVLVSSGGVKHGADVDVGVVFDENVDPATIVAGNFTLSAGSIKSVRFLKNSSTLSSFEQGAVITASGLTPGSSYTLTVKNVSDTKGNKITSANIPFTVSTLTWVALGAGDTTDFPAAALAVAPNGFNLNSGGGSYWGTSDDITFVYEEITGDFDKIARVEGQDASSQWARAGIAARASLDVGDTASRYQQVHVNPTIRADGGASNYSYETNRRLNTGGATSSSSGGGTPAYPHAWLRLRRAGDVFHMYRSDDAITWTEFNPTDFNPADGSNADGPLPAKMFVGLAFGPENGNITDTTLRNVWTAKFRDYGDYKPNKAPGKQTYSIGLNFQDSNTPNGLGPKEVAGVASIAQANWNNMAATATSDAPVALTADVAGAVKSTSATVEWACPNTWASTGRGEENNNFIGSDHALMTGYLDTGGATTTKVTLNNLPAELTGAAGGYDVVVYALGGVPKADRGGGYRITDLSGTELKPVVLGMSDDSPTDFVKIQSADATAHPKGTYVVFKGLTAKGIIIEGSTENGWASGSTPRAPINAVQVVIPTGAVDAPSSKPTVAIAGGSPSVITFTGTLQSAATVNGSYSDVAGAKSPYTVPAGAAQGFFRARQ